MSMSSSRPYLLRAVWEWLVDNDCTPHLLVDAVQPGVEVPTEFVVDGQIVLNVAPSAVQGLEMGNDEVSFSARFGGVPMGLRIPLAAVIGIYARENGQGMFFGEEEDPEDPEPDTTDSGDDVFANAGSHLRVVK